MARRNTSWRRSPTPDEPVEVTMSLMWKQILQIDELLGTTEVDMRVSLKWTDPRVATQMEADPHFELPADLWAPSVRLPIAQGERDTFVSDDASKWVMCVNPENGDMQMTFDYRGMISNPMSLDGFPYDVDSLDLRFAGNRLLDGRPASASDYVLVPADPFFATQFQEHLTEFTILGCTLDHYTRISGVGTPATYIVCGMTLRRKPMYYFWKVSFLLWLIFVLAMSAFLFEPHEIGDRLGILTTMFLASAATLFTLGHLPASDKLHRIDKNGEGPRFFSPRRCNHAFAARGARSPLHSLQHAPMPPRYRPCTGLTNVTPTCLCRAH